MGTAADIGKGIEDIGKDINLENVARGLSPAYYIGSEISNEYGKAQEASDKAAEEEAAAADRAAGIIQEQFRATTERLDPFIQGSTAAYQRQQALSGALGKEAQEQAYQEYIESPGVAFQREQGMKGINQQAAATGNLGGASRLKAISQFNQGLAQQDFQNQFNRLGAITGVGLGAATSLTGAGAQAAAGQAGYTGMAGSARAGGQLRRSDMFFSGLDQLGQLAGYGIGSL
ncbi:MAG: hypothetical protein GY760_29070 [Deltaproteobacteria bacterium]|nr:hypothetical protein [Deltaproteobacteria bacterium]